MAKHTLKFLQCGVNTARFLKYVWPFYNIVHERDKTISDFVKTLLTMKESYILVFSHITKIYEIMVCCNHSAFSVKVSQL